MLPLLSLSSRKLPVHLSISTLLSFCWFFPLCSFVTFCIHAAFWGLIKVSHCFAYHTDAGIAVSHLFPLKMRLQLCIVVKNFRFEKNTVNYLFFPPIPPITNSVSDSMKAGYRNISWQNKILTISYATLLHEKKKTTMYIIGITYHGKKRPRLNSWGCQRDIKALLLSFRWLACLCFLACFIR